LWPAFSQALTPPAMYFDWMYPLSRYFTV
jgi:hypothetical protein